MGVTASRFCRILIGDFRRVGIVGESRQEKDRKGASGLDRKRDLFIAMKKAV